MNIVVPLKARDTWPRVPAKRLFQRQRRDPRDADGIVTAFRNGEVTLRANRRTDGFTNAVQEHGYHGIRCGDLVIHSMDGFAGAIGVSDSDGKASPVVHCYQPREEIDARFYAYMLRDLAHRGFVTSLAKGIRERSTAFDSETFRSLVLPVPPVTEQRAIADFLDVETARIDALIAKKRRMIALFEERWMAYVESVLSPFEPSPLKRFVTKIGSGSTPRGGADVYVTRGSVFLRSQNILNGVVDLSDVVFIDEIAQGELRRALVHPGDVLLNITGGSIGRTAVFDRSDIQAYVSQHVCIVRPVRKVDASVLRAELSARSVQEQIAVTQVGGNREGLNFEQVGNLLVRVPPSDQSKTIAQELATGFSQHTLTTEVLQIQIDLLVERRLALVSAAVTGGLVVPGVAV